MIKTLCEILEANPNMTYNEASKIQKDMRVALEDKAAGFKTSTGVCIIAALKKDLQQNRPLTDTMDEIAYHELKNENRRLKNRVKELENSLSISLETNDQYQRNNKKLVANIDSLRDQLQVKILKETTNQKGETWT
jgi:predicted nuclease with TOPRIM domain|tara:strand:+ start:467 stop:874 length:408 start_codon:yes stop_codon:yes gene_type:complete